MRVFRTSALLCLFCSATSMLKSVKQVLPRPRQHWVGDGFHVFPVFADKAFTEALSPFLMFDYAAPKHFPPTRKQLGVGEHPHRGFETITIAFQGEVEHADSMGNRGVIGEGDVQWMTAGRGIIHEEFHSRKLAKDGGKLEMCVCCPRFATCPAPPELSCRPRGAFSPLLYGSHLQTVSCLKVPALAQSAFLQKDDGACVSADPGGRYSDFTALRGGQ